MRLSLILCLIVLVAGLCYSEERAWDSAVGPDGVTRIIVEAEDMEGVNQKEFGGAGPQWRVGRVGIDHYQNNTFGGHWQSRCRTAMTDAGGNVVDAVAQISVPRAGKYKLWAKYECPPFFNYAFDVAVQTADGKKTLFRKTYGLLDSPKHFCFTKKLTTGSLYWTWGIDHDAAEGYVVELPAGEYRLVMSKTKNPAPGGMRSIDAFMLTDDLSEISSPRYPRYPLLDELRRANHLFMRVRLHGPGPAQVVWNRWGKRYNDFYHARYMELVRYYDADGKPVQPPEKRGRRQHGQLFEPLTAGETSLWLDIGPTLNVSSAATFYCTASLVDERGRALKDQPDVVRFSVDFALAPDEKSIVKTFQLTPEEPGRQLTVLLQPDLTTHEGRVHTMKLVDAYRKVIEELDNMPRQGRVPRRMRVFSHTGGILLGQSQPWSREIEMEFRLALGLNTVFGAAHRLASEQYDLQRKWYAEHDAKLLKSANWHHSQDPERVAQRMNELGTVDEFYYLSYGDEIGLPRINANKPEMIAAFQEYLKAREVTPKELGLKNWEQVKPLNSLSTDVAVKIGVIPEGETSPRVARALKRLYWHSAQFRIHKGIEDFATKTAKLRELLGPHVHTSANLGGMHPFYWVHQSSFIEAFKHNAMTLAWTEDYDYTQPETSRLCVEMLAGYLKCGTKYNGQRMMFYCMPHYPGNSPEHLLQNFVLELGQNVKDFDWFCTPPDGFTTENYVNVRGGMPTFRVLRTASDILGTVEDWVEPAKAVQASVALLLSEASDTWEVRGLGQHAVRPGSEATNAFQEERKNVYYVLRNAGYRVDLLTEADVRDGRLSGYRALYVIGENMERDTVPKIAEWVKGGGVLYASAGAARKNEYDEPLDGLNAVVGRGKATRYERYGGPLRSKLELLFLEPLDDVTLKGAGREFPVYATLERFEPAKNAEVVATFADGAPAMVRVVNGKGTGYYVGAFPGESWARKALPVQPCGRGGPDGSGRYPAFEPVDFDAAAGAAILMPLRAAGVAPDFRVSTPHVVCNRLDAPNAVVLTVVNLGHERNGPVTDVTIDARGVLDRWKGFRNVKKAWSYGFPKGLEFKPAMRDLTIRLPKLTLVDVIVIETDKL